MKHFAIFPLILLLLIIGGIGVLASCSSNSDSPDDIPNSSSDTDNLDSSSSGKGGLSSSGNDGLSSSGKGNSSSSSNGGISSNVGKCMMGEDMCFQHEDVDEMTCTFMMGTYVTACPNNWKCKEIDEDGWEIFYYDEYFCSEGTGEPIQACMIKVLGFNVCTQGENIYRHECDVYSGEALDACPTDDIACFEEEDGITTFYYSDFMCH